MSDAYAALKTKTEEENDKIVAKNKTSDDLKAKVDQYRKDKVKEGEEIINKANVEKQNILDDAREQAKKITDDTNKIIADKKVEVDAANKQLDGINSAIKARNTILNDLNKKLGALQN